MKRLVISQPMLFPWIGMFEQIRLADVYVNYNDVQFSKGSFTNRVQIKTASGSQWLTVPTEKISLGQKIKEIKVSYVKDWHSEHKKLLESAYQQAPFFSEMMGLVEKIYLQKHKTLDEIGYSSMREVCDYFDFKNKTFLDVSELTAAGNGTERVLKIAQELKAQDYITGHGAKNYLDHEAFESNKIKVSYMDYLKKTYSQLHGDFTPYVSVLDLIAMKGRDGVEYICSQTVDWRHFK